MSIDSDTGTCTVISATHYLPLCATATSFSHPLVWVLSPRSGHAAIYAGIRSLGNQNAPHPSSSSSSSSPSATSSTPRPSSSPSSPSPNSPSLTTITIGCLVTYIDVEGQPKPTSSLSELNQTCLRQALWDYGKYVPIFIDETTEKNYYNGYCKQGLLFHHLALSIYTISLYLFDTVLN
ncbi:hypothetical protein AYI68_g6273 [Smittium mucronatum]|uniref:Uncharacterized protein n=1 Tax=Smittium mucronatum TaxID=133383 RepID=A0A1R0GRX4_9FUNG|nr:hypothetical protein AYI68_g6273 [Smittium mucronatum]